MNHFLHHCIYILLKIIAIDGLARWHKLEDRLDLKKNAEKVFSPTGKIMLNQLWNYDELKAKNKGKYPDELLEVDMDVTRQQKKGWSIYGFFFDNQHPAVRDPWPKRVVKYRFSKSDAVKDRTAFILAMESWAERVKCISFKEDNSSPESQVLTIVQRDITFASVGFRKDRKKHVLSVAEVAQTKPVILHLLGHVLGLPHSHSRPDRDRFIHWFKANLILTDVLFYNQKLDCPYDFESVMHYDHYAFTANRTGEMSFEIPDITFSDDPVFKDLIQKKTDLSFLLGYVLGYWRSPTISDVVRVETGYSCESTQSCLLHGYSYSALKMIPLPGNIKDPNPLFMRVEDNDVLEYRFNVKYSPAGRDYMFDMLYGVYRVVESDMACSRVLTFMQPAQRPTTEIMAFWLLSGCTFLQIDVYDFRWDYHELFCASAFARMYRKVLFTSPNFRIYLRMHRLDHPQVKKHEDGVIHSEPFMDFICSGDVLKSPPCQEIPDNKEGLVHHYNSNKESPKE